MPPVHPGEVLLHDFIEPLGLSQTALAKALGVTPIRINQIVRGHLQLTTLVATTLACCLPLPAQVPPAYPPYPDVTEMIRESFDDFPEGTIACGWEALRHRMRGDIYQSNPGRLDVPRLTQFERLVVGDPEDVAAVNREIIDYCRRKTGGTPSRRRHTGTEGRREFPSLLEQRALAREHLAGPRHAPQRNHHPYPCTQSHRSDQRRQDAGGARGAPRRTRLVT